MGFVIAYLFDPFLDALQRRGLPRWAAIWMVFLLFLLFASLLALFVLPPLVVEVRDLAISLKPYVKKLPDWMAEAAKWMRKIKLPPYLQKALEDAAGKAAQYLPALLGRMAKALVSGFSLAMWAVLVPIATYYFMREIDHIRSAVLRALPEDYRAELKKISQQVSQVVGRYLRGIALMCLVSGGLTWGAMALLRLKYALVVGIAAGVAYPIPYVGAGLSTLLALSLAAFTKSHLALGWNMWLYLGAVLSAMVANNQICDLLITPRIVGSKVGLNPLTVLISILVGAYLFGIWGVILAAPVAASLKAVAITASPYLRAALRRR